MLKEQLERLYNQEGKTTRQIAKELGATRRRVEYWLKKHGIPRRTPIETRFPERPKPTREALYMYYWVQWLSYEDIAKIYQVDASAIPYWLRKFDIPRRTNWGTRRKGSRVKEPTKDELTELYIRQGLSTADIGALYEISAHTVNDRLKDFRIELRLPGYNQERFTSKDGHVVLSSLERLVDDWLSDHGLHHIYEPELPFGGHADFLIGDTFIEVWGIEGNDKYRSRVRTKKRKYKRFGLNLIGLYPRDVRRKLDERLSVLLQ